MNREKIDDLLKRELFRPFELHLTNGDVYPVPHPEWAILLQTTLLIGFPDSDRWAKVSLPHIANVERLDTADRSPAS